jgi:hypothetical protein
MLGTSRFRLGCMRPTGESTRTSLISPVSPCPVSEFTVVVNNIRANVDVLPYNDHDRAVKLLHSLDHTIWGGKFEAIVESEKYDTLTVNELFSKLKSARWIGA